MCGVIRNFERQNKNKKEEDERKNTTYNRPNTNMSSLTPSFHNMMSKKALTRTITTAFKMSGLALRTDAVRALQSVLRQEEDVNAALDAILSAISKKISTSGLKTGSVVDLQTVEEVVTELTKNVDDRLREALSVVDAYDAPRLCYDPVKKSFYFFNARVGRGALESDHHRGAGGAAPSPGSSRSPVGGSGAGSSHSGDRGGAGGAYDTVNKNFHGSMNDKVEMFRERFQMIKQRVLRNPLFCRPSIGGGSSMSGGGKNEGHIELTPIDSLLGARGTLVLLGVLTRQEEGKYFLEDLNGSVEINLTQARVTDGLFTLGCIVVVEGTIGEETGIFQVRNFFCLFWTILISRFDQLLTLISVFNIVYFTLKYFLGEHHGFSAARESAGVVDCYVVDRFVVDDWLRSTGRIGITTIRRGIRRNDVCHVE